MDTRDRFCLELSGCGLDAGVIDTLGERYQHALRSGTGENWEMLYRELYAGLLALTHHQITRPLQIASLDSVLRILDDDLGAGLFGEQATAALRSSLMNRARLQRGIQPAYGAALP